METFPLYLLLLVLPLLSLACFVWLVLHGSNRLARWYRTGMRRRAYWLALWLTIPRHILLAVLFAYAWKKADLGLTILLIPFLVPDIGVTIVLDYLLGLPPGVYSGNQMGHIVAACCLTALGFFFLWYWFLNHVSQSLSCYDWQDSET